LEQFVEHNAQQAQTLFDKVAADDPGKALDLLVRLAEFIIPKLARTETTLEGELTVATRFVIKQPTFAPESVAAEDNGHLRTN
jgi:hypothetical protein